MTLRQKRDRKWKCRYMFWPSGNSCDNTMKDYKSSLANLLFIHFPVAQNPKPGLGRLVIEVFRPRSNTQSR